MTPQVGPDAWPAWNAPKGELGRWLLHASDEEVDAYIRDLNEVGALPEGPGDSYVERRVSEIDAVDVAVPYRAALDGLWARVEHLEQEVSRLRECRDVWKLQAESLATRRRGLRRWLYLRSLRREFRRERAKGEPPRVLL